MIALLVSTVLSYGLRPNVGATYDVNVHFNGYIPILGGRIAKVDVQMGVDVFGLAPDEKGMPRASSEIMAFSLEMDGAKLPVGLKNILDYFPKTTVVLSPHGKILKSDAPDIQLPFRLPGLDVKRFPDITYLPIEFPEAGIEEGKPFTFKKQFGDSDVAYTVTPISIKDDLVVFDVKLAQTFLVLEDGGGNVIKSESDAVKRVTTNLSGSGKVVFDRKLGLVSSVDIEADAQSKAVDTRSKSESARTLKTVLNVKLKSK